MTRFTHVARAALCVCALLALPACDVFNPPKPRPTIIGVPVSTQPPLLITQTEPATPLLAQPTPTEIPRLVAKVNDEPITVEAFNTEVLRYLGDVSPDSDIGKQQIEQLKPLVLRELIQRVLIRQEAERQGIAISEQQIDDEIGIAKQRLGDDAAYDAWLTKNRLSADDARAVVRQELTVGALRDRVLSGVPREAEHVRAYHVVVATEQEAQLIERKLGAGGKIGPIARAQSIDASTRGDDGDLGWFAFGTETILWPEVEAAAFALQPGETSPIVRSPIGFHLIRVTARETRPLGESELLALQRRALEQWMAGLEQAARIERFI
jgi:parvulin-like peptidyl-prolyl isomerase